MDCKANLIWPFPDDLNIDKCRVARLVTGIAHVRKSFYHERKELAQQGQNRDRTIPIPDVSWLGIKNESATIRINHSLTFAALDLLPRIVTARSTTLGGFDALTIQNSGTW